MASGLLDAYGHPIDPGLKARSRSELVSDSWRNFTTGVGTGRDKTMHGSFWAPWRVLDNELLALYNGSDLAAKIVEKPAIEMFRRGYKLEAKGKGGDEIEASELEEFQEETNERLRLDDQMEEAEVWGRLFGGDLSILGVDDGQAPDKPLNEDRIKSFDYINNIDRRFVWVQSYYSDPFSPKYGLPELYLITNVVSVSRPLPGQVGTAVVHESRCIRHDGNKTDVLTRQQLAGWSWSVLQRVYDTLRRFEHSFDAVDGLLSDASQAVFKLRGLIEAISSGRKQDIQARMAMVDESRSTIRAVLLDAGDGEDGNPPEDFARQPTPFGGIADILDRKMMRLAAAADMPVTELFGRAAAGLNATGENDTRKWYDLISSKQTKRLKPKMERIWRLAAKAKNSTLSNKNARICVEFLPLWSPTDAEQAETDLNIAKRDQIYIQEGVVTEIEVALDRANFYPSMDVDAREKAKDGATQFDPYSNDPLASQAAQAATMGEMGESQSPAVPLPLPGSPQAEGSQKKDAWNQARTDSPADDVWEIMTEDFPEDAISWVKSAPWRGPSAVSLDRIDFSGRKEWKANEPSDAKRVKGFADDLEAGRFVKPIVLVQKPKGKAMIVDGHHRALAAKQLGSRTIRAYVAKVDAAEGPWDETHASQRGETSR